MDLKIVQKIINSKNKYDLNLEIKKISTNSKDIEPGDIFLALNSGYLYIEEAIKNGAVAIISEKNNLDSSVPVLEVLDSKLALKSLGSYYRTLYKGKVIGITGSNGKTTTKELLKHILSSKYKVLANPSSENNILGISKTLLELNNDYDILILELGMNHKGEISELSTLIKPDIGIITNIGSSHIGYLGSKENIFKAKMEILDGNQNMKLYVNGLDELLKEVDAIKVIPKKDYADIHPVNTALAHQVSEYLEIEEEKIDSLIKSFPCVKSRMQKHIIGTHIVIDDAYNASYESFKQGLDEISKYDKRKIIIFGDMLELGFYSALYHQKVYDEISEMNNVVLITLGRETAILNNNFHFFDIANLKEFLKSFTWLDDDIIYLKASHSLNLSNLISFFEKLW